MTRFLLCFCTTEQLKMSSSRNSKLVVSFDEKVNPLKPQDKHFCLYLYSWETINLLYLPFACFVIPFCRSNPCRKCAKYPSVENFHYDKGSFPPFDNIEVYKRWWINPWSQINFLSLRSTEIKYMYHEIVIVQHFLKPMNRLNTLDLNWN
jgi:hypothetical protein